MSTNELLMNSNELLMSCNSLQIKQARAKSLQCGKFIVEMVQSIQHHQYMHLLWNYSYTLYGNLVTELKDIPTFGYMRSIGF